MKKRIGVYAGSFNPWHSGHANILHQSLRVFDEVIIAIGKNTEKESNDLEPFPVNNPVLGRAHVDYYSGLLSDYLDSVEFNCGDNADVFLIPRSS